MKFQAATRGHRRCVSLAAGAEAEAQAANSCHQAATAAAAEDDLLGAGAGAGSRCASPALGPKLARGAPLAVAGAHRDACQDGLAGIFSPLRNDFTPLYDHTNHYLQHMRPPVDQLQQRSPSAGAAWSATTISYSPTFSSYEPVVGNTDAKKSVPVAPAGSVSRFRFVVCLLGLVALALGAMSRALLNVAIVQMTVKEPSLSLAANLSAPPPQPPSMDLNLSQAQAQAQAQSLTQTQTQTLSPDWVAVTTQDSHEQQSPSDQITITDDEELADGELRFDWTVGEQNFLLSSFYIGYCPSMMFGGSLADAYGSKYPLFVAVAASALINAATPAVARWSLDLLVGSRILLGLLQGSLVPALYDLFNKWLTPTETSIFAPMIKVSLALGSLLGSLVPGVLAWLEFEWPHIFYFAGMACAIWSAVWLLLATSTPQTNPMVDEAELDRIVRKKPLLMAAVLAQAPPSSPLSQRLQSILALPADGQLKANGLSAVAAATDATIATTRTQTPSPSPPPTSPDGSQDDNQSTPWLLILTNPSMLALILVKFTYNLGVDFTNIELALYMDNIHGASMEFISLIGTVGSLMQVLLVTLVGWLAKILVRRRALGFGRTAWRKIFQGAANFSMAAMYLALPLAGQNLPLVTCIMFLIYFGWILGAGGESMVPYDLSSRYPATIMGLAHAMAISSGLVLPSVCSLVLGGDNGDPRGWNLLFAIIAGSMIVGGLVFVLVLKAKPFLPGEKAEQEPAPGPETETETEPQPEPRPPPPPPPPPQGQQPLARDATANHAQATKRNHLSRRRAEPRLQASVD